MKNKNDKNISRFLSLILRHKPESVDVEMDEYGYVDVEVLLEGMNKSGKNIDREDLDRIVSEDDKQRYSYSEDGKSIRANQGHSLQVNLDLKIVDPPKNLYHGTGEKYVDSILKQGIKPKSRQYVHLSKDIETALNVGGRHGKPVVLSLDVKSMVEDGCVFYISENGIYLTGHVEAKYLEIKNV